MILGDFLKALGQLGDPRFRRVLWLGLALTVGLLFAAYAVFLSLVAWLSPETVDLPFIGEVTWVSDLLGFASILLMLTLSIFLMLPVASAFTSLFLDDVVDAVEARHYPHLTPAARVPFLTGLMDSLSFLGLLIGANLLAILLYIVIPPATPVIFYAVNGFLLGREFFQMVAIRRLGRAGARSLGRRHTGRISMAGLLMAIPLSIPLVNLIIPILGAATFTHLYHRLAPSG